MSPLKIENELHSQIVAAARSWIGTPYVHQAATKGAGCDCLGLVRGVWREVMGSEPETPPPYTRDWAERKREETLRDAASRHMDPVPIDQAGPGDVLLFAFKTNLPAKHCAILTTAIDDPAPRIIHAHERLPVAEVALVPGWRRKIRFAFGFPGVSDLSSRADRPAGCPPDGADHQVRRPVGLAEPEVP
ncbi:NlpC/P60 family protein [Roseibium sp.]|uniref:NlpC/P60 family protein n=1 Tax=Roseibium sp. TaxID=1936156 RepID=UPI003A984158